MSNYLAIDIGGTAIKYALMDENANILEKGETPTDTSAEGFYASLDKAVLPYRAKVEGIGMSVPGRINVPKGIAHSGGAMTWILNEPMKEKLEARYGLKVWFENDAKCAALAESWKGNLVGAESGFVVILGTGIGGGIVMNGKVYRGVHGSAGEFSNSPENYDDPYYGLNWAQNGAYRGLLIPYAEAKGIDYKSIDGRKFFEAYHAGDADAAASLKHYAKVVAAGIINIQVVLDVDKVCIGGGIAAQDVLIDEIRAAVHEYFVVKGERSPIIEPVVERCYFSSGANLVGALRTYLIMEGLV